MDDLDRLITEAFDEYGEFFIDESEIDTTPHRFSEDFERRMEAAIAHSKRRHIKLTPKLAIDILIAVIVAIIASAVTVVAVQKRQSKIQKSKPFGNGSLGAIYVGSEPEGYGERDYGQGYYLREQNPYGFKMTLHEDTSNLDEIIFVYRRSIYENEFATIEIYEGTPVSSGAIIYEKDTNEMLDIDGAEVYYLDYAYISSSSLKESLEYEHSHDISQLDGMTLLWNEEGHIVQLSLVNKESGNYTKKDLIDIYKFVYKAE